MPATRSIGAAPETPTAASPTRQLKVGVPATSNNEAAPETPAAVKQGARWEKFLPPTTSRAEVQQDSSCNHFPDVTSSTPTQDQVWFSNFLLEIKILFGQRAQVGLGFT